MNNDTRYTVIGAGHGGKAMAADLAAKGFTVNLYNTGGALEFRQILNREGCTADVIVAEASTFVFASRSTGPAQARIFRRKNAVPLAALPATRTSHVLETVYEAYPQFIPVPNVLHTSLDNMGAIFHPALTLLNAGWIERTKGDFQFYIEGVTRSTAHVLEVLDRERVTIAAALGVRARPALSGRGAPTTTPRAARFLGWERLWTLLGPTRPGNDKQPHGSSAGRAVLLSSSPLHNCGRGIPRAASSRLVSPGECTLAGASLILPSRCAYPATNFPILGTAT